MNWKILVIGVLLIAVLSGCTDGGDGSTEILKADDSKATAEGTANLVAGNNQFALELYPEFNEEGKNAFFSPWSISSALGMTYEGARGKTAEEMRDVLHFPENDIARRSSFASLYNKINEKEKAYELSTANALWAEKNYPFLEEYTGTVENYYAGKVTNLDFITDAENSRQTINSWVEKQTKDKIKNLLPQGSIDHLTRLVLTNAVYFKGTWVMQFDKGLTKDEDFKVNAEETVKVPMMYIGKEETFNYAETDELQAIELPYKGEKISMLILLPKENKMEELENLLNVEKLNELRDSLREQEVVVSIPKFKFETEYSMADTLNQMGMPNAFNPAEADFSGMDGTKNLFISAVIHKAYVDVNEEGTEAAAATAIIMTMGAARSERFNADHPFIFIIQQKETGTILFMGKVVNPVA